MCREDGLRLLWCHRFEVKGEPCCVPVAPEIVDNLGSDGRPPRIPVSAEPCVEFDFRPEGRDVGSGEPDVVPEPLRGDKEMDNRLTDDSTAHDY